MHRTFILNGHTVAIRKLRFANNGSPQLMAYELDEFDQPAEPYGKLLVNLNDTDIIWPEKQEVFVDINRSYDSYMFLIENFLGMPGNSVGYSGWCVYPSFKLSDEVLETKDGDFI